MIFVILGTQKFQLNRLLVQLDKLIEEQKISEPVFAQIGHSDYHPVHYDYTDFLDKDMFEKKIHDADLIITHSGVGSIVTALKYYKPVVVFPRRAAYKEHVDDHQLEIAKAFEKKHFVICCYDENDLNEKIKESAAFPFERYHSQKGAIIEIVKNFLGDY